MTTPHLNPESGHSPDLQAESTGDLIARLSTQMSQLVKGEVELAKSELAAKAKRAGVGAGMAGAGGVLALFGGGALVTAAISALALVWPVWLAALVVGVLLIIVAGALVIAARGQLRRITPLAPEHSIESVRDDVTVVREAVRR